MTAMVHWNRFRFMASGVLVAGVAALGLAMSVAVAQDAAPAAGSAQPKAAAPAATAATAPAGDRERLGQALHQERADRRQANLPRQPRGPRAQYRHGARCRRGAPIEGDDKQHLLVRLPTAYSLVMPAGVQIKIDEGEPIATAIRRLLPDELPGPDGADARNCSRRLRKGKQMTVAAMNMQQKTMAFPVPLTGFSKTFDGPPVDNAAV